MKDTLFMQKKALSKSTNDILNFLDEYQNLCVNWKNYINFILDTEHYSFSKISAKIGFSKNTIQKWCVNGDMLQNREAFIKLAFGLNLSLDDTNKLLSTYGKYSTLYAKDINDAITIYVLSKHHREPDNEFYSYDSLKKWRSKYEDIAQKRRLNNGIMHDRETVGFYTELKAIQAEEEFEKFIELNQLVFFSSYAKLIMYIDEFIKIRINENELLNDETYSFHKLMQGKKNGLKLEKMFSKLKNYGIVPERKYLIVLGIHLNMTLFEINKLLKLANMKTLYARDRFDCILICVIHKSMIVDSDLVINNALKMEQLTYNSEWRKEFRNILLRYMDDDTSDVSEEYIEKISDFIIKELKMVGEDSKEIKDIIELLE